MARDAADRLANARSLSIGTKNRRFHNSIGGGDSDDFLKIRLKHRSLLKLKLKGLSQNADLELIQDRDRDGAIDPGEVVASSRAKGQRNDKIRLKGIDRGLYYIRVTPNSGRETEYTLVRSARKVKKADRAYALVKRTNQFRQAEGLPALAVNTQLTKAAKRYAKAMAKEDFFSHRGDDGSTPWQRIRQAGYDYSEAAENLAAGHKTPRSVLEGWKDSPGHRANLLAYQVQEVGIGYFYLKRDRGQVQFNRYWAQSLATPAGVNVSAGSAGETDGDTNPTRFPNRD